MSTWISKWSDSNSVEMNRGNNPPCFCVLRASASIFKSPNSNANSMRMQMFSGSAVSDASNFYAFLLLSSPRWTSAHTHIHTLAGSAEGCKRGCLEEVPTDATASHIQIIHLVFFFFYCHLSHFSATLRHPQQASFSELGAFHSIVTHLFALAFLSCQIYCRFGWIRSKWNAVLLHWSGQN